MKFTELSIEGAFHVELEPHHDERGFFARAWCAAELAEHGAIGHIEQMNLANNVQRGTIRGMHVQLPPLGEAKFIRCVSGRTLHVVADLREESSTYGQWAGVELSAERHDAIFVPPHCANGYQTLVDGTTVLYAMSSTYTPGVEMGFRYDDPELGISWPITEGIVLSEKDRTWPAYRW